MKIILIRLLLAIGAMAILGWVIIGTNKYLDNKKLQDRLSQFTGEYAELAQKCLWKEDGITCCISSVQSMQDAQATLTPEKWCPDGSVVNSLKCISSYAWCEKKDLKPKDLKWAPPKEIIKYY